MNLDDAITKHAEWKVRFRAAISKREKIDLGTVANDHGCELGRWLFGEGRAKYGSHGAHAECVAKHAEFHKAASQVARLINDGSYAQAETSLGAASPFGRASSAVGVAILQLKKVG